MCPLPGNHYICAKNKFNDNTNILYTRGLATTTFVLTTMLINTYIDILCVRCLATSIFVI